MLALLSPKATSARADVMEGIVWMRERLAAVERSPQAMLTRCIELQKTAKEMHAHYLKQVVPRLSSTDKAARQGELDELVRETEAAAQTAVEHVKTAAEAGGHTMTKDELEEVEQRPLDGPR